MSAGLSPSSSDEVAALLAAPDLRSRIGRRDRAVLLLAVQTGLRRPGLTGLRCGYHRWSGARCSMSETRRKVRDTPLRKPPSRAYAIGWAVSGYPSMSSFQLWPVAMNRVPLQYLLNKHLAVARDGCPSLAAANVRLMCSGIPGDGSVAPRCRPFSDRALARPQIG